LKFADLLRSTFSHRHDFLFESLACHPQTRLENSDDFRFVLFRQRQQVSRMIGMRMRQKDRVEPRNLL
jgi:hypothetical protein